MIVFIDTEVGVSTQKVQDFGAVREDGAVLHTHSSKEFNEFISKCDTLCGHNIIGHDLKYVQLQKRYQVIDTLPLSPLLFPNKPYHRLVKDDKLQVDELNNPVNDAKKARDLFYDELEVWKRLNKQRQEILYQLLHNKTEFEGFFKYTGYIPHIQPTLINRLLSSKTDVVNLITSEYHGKICGNANLNNLINDHPIELAYALAIIGADDIMSITPAWVQRNYPHMSKVMDLLRNTPCAECEYCRNHLDAHKGLQDFFGYNEFRLFDGKRMQQEAVESAIKGESLLTIFPTGGGKSLTFQLPALMAGRNMHGLTVVISPLQSLMKDQVDNLTERGISDAVTINGLLDPIERASAVQQVFDGSANLLYIAPEMLRSKTIERLLLGRNVVRFVIDEAHCFSAWGQDFRVDYLYIGDFIRKIQELKQQHPIAVSCFTATAKQKVITDICDYFAQKLNLKLKVFAANSERKNLHYTVIHSDTDDDKYNQLRSLILGHQCPSIVYVSRTKRTKELADRLRADGIYALPFNGKMESADKIRNQDAFMSGKVQVIVATSAFGMGVDKKDVGLVIHYDISDSLESYIQEAGRAGRDPHMEADCYVLYADSDLDKHFILLNQTKLSISEIQQVWKAIKDMTQQRPTVSCSPLEIARKAGWGDEVDDVETRIKAAIAALEDAGFIERGSNAPHVFATGITIGNMDEARKRITQSPLFDDTTREEAVRIISSLISRRATKHNVDDAESRIDYLADVLGMTKEAVIRNVNLMRQEGILADSQDMLAGLPKSNTMRELKNTLQLERFLLEKIADKTRELNYKELNEEAQSKGMSFCNVKRLKTLLYFLRLKGYVRKEEHTAAGSVSLRLQVAADITMQHFERRSQLCQYIIETINKQKAEKESTFVPFSLVGILNQYVSSQLSIDAPPSIADMEEALLFLSKNELLKLEGGFLVIYNTMQLKRKVERRTRYTKENYRLLDEFYKQRIQQIHIVGEYANLMVRDYNAALQYVSDYFTMDYRRFINKYFKEDRKTEINQNITPAKYKKIFSTLSRRQLEIINDRDSRYIVVAAGPGSGKTRVLVHKLASLLLLEDVKHEQLLMLTFSRAAATEFKKRLIELVGNAAHFVDIKTFHSYSFDLLGKQGSLEEADSVVQRAAEMIERGEVENSKIAKTVLVIDEAQDMGPDDYRLVQALMQRNEEMRVIAVGDDDQNIYAFRGSNSKYLQSLVSDHGAVLYEMIDNYRSTQDIVNYANQFVQRIPNRMKHTPIKAVASYKGVVKNIPVGSIFSVNGLAIKGTTAVLTRTNEQALQVAYQLKQQGIRAILVQADNSFRFINLAEVRYFVKHVGNDGSVISDEIWQAAKERTCQTYATSKLLPAMKRFWEEYEQINRIIYRSDLRQFLLESEVEDFVSLDGNCVFVSTIHKAKGREFDTVHLFVHETNNTKPEDLRTIYVGLTRARQNLYIYHNPVLDQTNISISLSLHDVWLDYFKERKDKVLRLRSGEGLRYSNGYLVSQHGDYIACLSKTQKEQMKDLQQKGYIVNDVEVSYILAWRPREESQEVAVCLANIILKK